MSQPKRDLRSRDNHNYVTAHERKPATRDDVASEFIVRALIHLLATNPFHLAALKSLTLRPAGLPIDDFDRINAPHGSQVRGDLAPLLVRVAGNHVTITALGGIAVDAANAPPWHVDP
jgi:hypothetical protein